MLLNLVYDSNALAAPQSFRDGMQSAANIIDAAFSDNITVNIYVGYGEITNDPINNPSSKTTLTGGLSEGGPLNGVFKSYSLIRSKLAALDDSAVQSGVNFLPTGSSIQGQNQVVVWAAEEKALGLLSATNSGLDGTVGFAAGIPTNELVGVALHELTHAMGRSAYSGAQPDVLDLFRFAPGSTAQTPVWQFGDADPTATASYFSLDGSATDLADYGETSDPSDYLNNSRTTHDAFNEFYSSSTIQSLTPLDILQMEALGFHAQPVGPAPVPMKATDLAFIKTGTGDWGFMSPTGSGESWHPVGPSSITYQAMASGDFNHDGLFDMAFRNTSTGDWGFLTPLASGGEGWTQVGSASLSYAVAAIADFNGDGASDIAFRSGATGDFGYMSVNPGGGQTWHPVGPTSIAYAPVGAADFNSDGVMDVAFRNLLTGDWGYMSVNPGGGETWHGVGPSSTDYTVIGVGDFNNDGHPDVAFRQNSTGNWGFLTPLSGGGEAWTPAGSASTAYAAVKTADFNGDGSADIAFRNAATGDWGYMSYSASAGEIWHPAGASSTDYFTVA